MVWRFARWLTGLALVLACLPATRADFQLRIGVLNSGGGARVGPITTIPFDSLGDASVGWQATSSGRFRLVPHVALFLVIESAEPSVGLMLSQQHGSTLLSWPKHPLAFRYELYRCDAGVPPVFDALVCNLSEPTYADSDIPPVGTFFAYVGGASTLLGTTGIGTDSGGEPRVLGVSCP